MTKAILVAAAVIIAPLHASAASISNSWLSNVSLTMSPDPVTQNETVYVTTKLTSSFGILPVTIPLLNPKKLTEVIGSVAIVSDITGVNYSLQIAIDVTAAAKVKAAGLGLLPNGTLIPVGGVNMMNWITLPLQGNKGVIYLNLDSTAKSAVVGASINVAAFGTGLPINMLIPFNIKNIGGLAGIYTGQKGQGGFGFFVDGSSLFKK